jgi:hypothetical protein
MDEKKLMNIMTVTTVTMIDLGFNFVRYLESNLKLKTVAIQDLINLSYTK